MMPEQVFAAVIVTELLDNAVVRLVPVIFPPDEAI